MAYSRIQGKKLIILHSKRIDGKVKQEKLFTFETFNDAAETVNADNKWALFCETLSQQYKIDINQDKLKKGIQKKLASIEYDDTDFFNASVTKVLGFLLNCKLPLSPKQKQMLSKGRKNLEQIRDIIDKKLILLDDLINSQFEAEPNVQKNLDRGLDQYEMGKWDEAKAYFLQGLKLDPEHVDLLVYAGIIELIYENYSLAYNYFDDASRIGKHKADLMIQCDPETYVKEIDLDQWADGKHCRYINECPNWDTEECLVCEDNPKNEKTDLYRYLEFRPFFRAIQNKAIVLMKLKRYKDAIETLELCQEYQSLFGTYNMIGICYLNLNDYQKADEWYNEFLWDEVYYVKALIKFKMGQTENALKYLFQGVIKNQHIAKILIGKEKPEDVRYLNGAFSEYNQASEFYHEGGYLFTKTPDFKILLRCIMEDKDVIELLEVIEKDSQQDNKKPTNKSYWNLKYGHIEDSFLNLFVPSFVEKLNDKNLSYWQPKENETLEILILKKNNQNWLVKLPEFENEFYFRPKSYFDCDDRIKIKVTKSWFYRKRLFVAGEKQV